MEQLTGSDVRAILDFLHGSYEVRDLNGFVRHIITSLPSLVPADATVYNEYNFKRNRIVWEENPVVAFAGSQRIWERYSDEHPILNHIRSSKDGRAVKFSDFISHRQFRRTHLYNEFFRPLNINHQMHVLFSEPQNLLVGIALNRKSKDFSERERLVLNLLRPHLLRAYQNAGAVAEIMQQATALKSVVDELGGGVIFLSPKGQVKSMTETARSWLDKYFGRNGTKRNHLPEEIELWVKQQNRVLDDRDAIHSPKPPLLTIERDGARLQAKLIRHGEQNVVLLEERRTSLNPSSLESLGLTRREAEVLAWMAFGKTNAEIGMILDTRPRTIEKHVERILQKLGVETRTAAVAVALRVLQPIPDRT